MSERENLIELLKNAKKYATSTMAHLNIDEAIDISYDDLQSDYLLENGVIVPPVTIGQTVYEIQQDRTLQKWYVYGIIKYDGQEWAAKAKNNKNKWNYIDKTFAFRLFGKTVFLTRKAAEKALKEADK